MKEIQLTQGKVALVDDEDFEYLNQWKWYVLITKHTNYAVHHNKKGKVELMHREIMKTPKGMYTDHINHDGLDNRRCNLRVCTNGQNLANRTPRGTSKYLGVYFHTFNKGKKGKKYIYCVSNIRVNGKTIALGYFKSEKEAALAYDEAAKKYHGEFANLNFTK